MQKFLIHQGKVSRRIILCFGLILGLNNLPLAHAQVDPNIVVDSRCYLQFNSTNPTEPICLNVVSTPESEGCPSGKSCRNNYINGKLNDCSCYPGEEVKIVDPLSYHPGCEYNSFEGKCQKVTDKSGQFTCDECELKKDLSGDKFCDCKTSTNNKQESADSIIIIKDLKKLEELEKLKNEKRKEMEK